MRGGSICHKQKECRGYGPEHPAVMKKKKSFAISISKRFCPLFEYHHTGIV